MSCTARQVSYWLKQIGKRQQMDMYLDASLHGIKMPAPSSGTTKQYFSDDEDILAERAMASAMARKKSEMMNG